MKNLFKSALVLLIGLSSCNKENVVPTPDPTSADEAKMRESALPSTSPKNYKLVKDGDAKLSYDGSGRVVKVTFGAGKRNAPGPTGIYVEYKYGAHQINSTAYYKNAVYQRSTYLLDNAGRCYESKQLDYQNAGQNAYVEKESSFTYSYDQNGRLKSRTNKANPNQTTLYSWNAAGDMTKVSGTDFYAGRAYEPHANTNIQLSYNQIAGDPLLDNVLPVNEDAFNLPDTYLPVFGKKSLHLVKLYKEQFTQYQQYYNYLVNTDGYPTKKETYEIAGAKLIETRSFDYLVTEIGLHL